MGKKYSAEERNEAVRLAGEIGAKAASVRLGINTDTIYTWISKTRQKESKTAATIAAHGETEGLAAENEHLRKQLREQEEEIELLQDALGFFAKRRKK